MPFENVLERTIAQNDEKINIKSLSFELRDFLFLIL